MLLLSHWWYSYNSPYLLDLFVVRRRGSIQIRRHLRAKISACDEGLQDIRQDDIGVWRCIVLNIVIRYVDVLETQ